MARSPDPPITLGSEAVRNLVFSSNAEVQARFRAEFPAEIERALAGVTAAYRAMDLFRYRLQGSNQTATLELFFHAAANSVLCSLHHLVSGYPIAAGNLMRHYTECVAMALLCLDPSIGVLEAYTRQRKEYPVHNAPTRLRRRNVRSALKAKLEFDPAAWETVLEIAQLYDQLSHASALSLAHQIMVDTDNMMIIGSEYDPAKREPYRQDLVRRASAAESLAHLIHVTITILPQREAA
jgi:hypothetical protein